MICFCVCAFVFFAYCYYFCLLLFLGYIWLVSCLTWFTIISRHHTCSKLKFSHLFLLCLTFIPTISLNLFAVYVFADMYNLLISSYCFDCNDHPAGLSIAFQVNFPIHKWNCFVFIDKCTSCNTVVPLWSKIYRNSELVKCILNALRRCIMEDRTPTLDDFLKLSVNFSGVIWHSDWTICNQSGRNPAGSLDNKETQSFKNDQISHHISNQGEDGMLQRHRNVLLSEWSVYVAL